MRNLDNQGLVILRLHRKMSPYQRLNLEFIGLVLGISVERARQLEAIALKEGKDANDLISLHDHDMVTKEIESKVNALKAAMSLMGYTSDARPDTISTSNPAISPQSDVSQ